MGSELDPPPPFSLWGEAKRKPHWLIAFAYALFLPFVGWFLARFDLLSNRWMIEESAQRYVWMAGLAATAVVAFVIALGPGMPGKTIAVVVGWSLFGGVMIGPQVMILANCAWVSTPAQTTQARYAEATSGGSRSGGDRIRFQAASAPEARFVASLKKWNQGGGKIQAPRPIVLRRGRLGLRWGDWP